MRRSRVVVVVFVANTRLSAPSLGASVSVFVWLSATPVWPALVVRRSRPGPPLPHTSLEFYSTPELTRKYV